MRPNAPVAFKAAPECRGTYGRLRSAAIAGTAVLLLNAPVAGLAGSPVSSSVLSPWRGGENPTFILDDIERRKVALTAHAGKVVLVHFFATWCEPCREELPALRRLVARSNPEHFAVIAVSIAEPEARVRAFIDSLSVNSPVNFPVLLDADRTTAKSWGVYALPTTFVLDRNLKPQLFVERDYDWDKFDATRAVTSGPILPGN